MVRVTGSVEFCPVNMTVGVVYTVILVYYGPIVVEGYVLLYTIIIALSRNIFRTGVTYPPYGALLFLTSVSLKCARLQNS